MDICLFEGMDPWLFAVCYKAEAYFCKVKARMVQYGVTILPGIRPPLSRPDVLPLVSNAVKFE